MAATFRVNSTFAIKGRGLVISGQVAWALCRWEVR
jgi:hypothetical protein